MLTASSSLAIFAMFGISSFAVFWARRLQVPHTVLLVVIGIGLGLLAMIPGFGFFTEFTLTPELLFYILLPTLIFESAYNINVRRMVEDTSIILILSIVGLLVSTIVIAVGLTFFLSLLGITVPFIISLLFGALISATDPVAVLALFKEIGAPKRLSLIFEGESLFNDATAVALFLVILEVVIHGFEGFSTITEGVISFTSMMVGGVLFGLLTGGIFAKLVGLTRENEIASITLTIVLAHATFILAELLSHQLVIGEMHFPLSPIIATTVAALLMGNYGRAKIHPQAEEFVEKLWGQLAFLANSLIFILIGILFVAVPIFEPTTLIVIGITILLVAFARAVSIYPVVGLFNVCVKSEQRLSLAWQHLLSWGSLRGALAVTMVLLIPADLTVPGWDMSMTVREFLLAITVGCIFATLFIKATTIQRFMRFLKLTDLTELEAVEYQEAQALVHHEVSERLTHYVERGYIESDVATSLKKLHITYYEAACAAVTELSSTKKNMLAHRVLRLYAIGIERRQLKELYHHNEVNEDVFRRLGGKLQIQFEAIEAGELSPNLSLHTDGKDVFDQMASAIHSLFGRVSELEQIEQQYMYYRAQTILSRKVLKKLQAVDRPFAASIFTSEAFTHVVELYTTFKDQSHKKMSEIRSAHGELLQPLIQSLAECSVEKIEQYVLKEVHENELITPKLRTILEEEIETRRLLLR